MERGLGEGESGKSVNTVVRSKLDKIPDRTKTIQSLIHSDPFQAYKREVFVAHKCYKYKYKKQQKPKLNKNNYKKSKKSLNFIIHNKCIK